MKIVATGGRDYRNWDTARGDVEMTIGVMKAMIALE